MEINWLSTSVSDVYANNPAALSLVETFNRCPAAQELLASAQEIKPLMIKLTDDETVSRTIWGKENDEFKTMLSIVDVSLMKSSYPKPIEHVAFEFFNALQRTAFLQHQNQVDRGELSIDAHALGMEKIEYETLQKSQALIQRCQSEWQINPRKRNLDPIFNLFEKEVTCHTDLYRMVWVYHHQADYCRQYFGVRYLTDRKSCSASLGDFCDYRKMIKKVENHGTKLICERIGKVFPNVNETVRTNPNVIASINELCPNYFLKSASHNDEGQLFPAQQYMTSIVGFAIPAILAVARYWQR